MTQQQNNQQAQKTQQNKAKDLDDQTRAKMMQTEFATVAKIVSDSNRDPAERRSAAQRMRELRDQLGLGVNAAQSAVTRAKAVRRNAERGAAREARQAGVTGPTNAILKPFLPKSTKRIAGIIKKAESRPGQNPNAQIPSSLLIPNVVSARMRERNRKPIRVTGPSGTINAITGQKFGSQG